MDEVFIYEMDCWGKPYQRYMLIKGDFLDPKYQNVIDSSTVIFTNNFSFGSELDQKLKG